MVDAPPRHTVEVCALSFMATGVISPADLNLLDQAEQVRAADLASEQARRRFVTSHALLRRLLGRHLGVAPCELSYERSCEHCGHPSHGRPRLVDGAVSFSLSHCATHVVVAIANGPVGVDVEDPNRRAVVPGVVRRCCSADEQRWWAAQPDSDRQAAFLALWTRKEALSKAVGLGMAARFSSLDVLSQEPIVVYPGATPLVALDLELAPAVGAVACGQGSVLTAMKAPRSAAGQ